MIKSSHGAYRAAVPAPDFMDIIKERELAKAESAPEPPPVLFNESNTGKPPAEPGIYGAQRPANQLYEVQNETQFWNMYALMDWFKSNVPILATIVKRTCMELFRYEIAIKPKFAYKCESCGHETQYYVKECSQCGSLHLRRPDESQKEYLYHYSQAGERVSFIDEANNNGQSLLDVLWSFAESELLYNEGYILCVTGDIINENGDLQKQVPLEFVAQDPKYVRYLYDDTGTPGRRFAFTYDQRDILLDLDQDPEAVNDVAKNGATLIPALWQIGSQFGGNGRFLLYGAGEVFQDHWDSPALIYGRPSWLDMEDEMLTYHYQNKHNLKKYKFGYVRKILVLPGFNEAEGAIISKGIADVLSKNTNSIPIVCTPMPVPGVPQMDAQVLDLGVESSQDLMAVRDDITAKLCAHGCLPNILAGDVESSGGMNNESQQITIFDRYILGRYNKVDRALRWIQKKISSKVTDWEIVLGRPSKAYTDVKKMIDNIQVAQGMQALGIPMGFLDGEFRYGEVSMEQVMQEAELRRQGLMTPGGSKGGQTIPPEDGMMPGDGDGPPELGTARREDPDIDEAKNEEELTQREADDASEV